MTNDIMGNQLENSSGQGESAAVPKEIDHWNWGAFFLNWIWGIGNNTLIALLTFVPFVGLVMPFVLGAKGSTWAWQNKRWNSIEEFKQVQRSWAKWGFIIFTAFVTLIAAMIFVIVTAVKNTEIYKLSSHAVQQSELVIQELGSPLSTGFPKGSVQISGPTGKADISFSVEGPKGSGTVYIDAFMDMGRWKLNRMELEVEKTGKRIDLNTVAGTSS